jgi:hypothetical protein
MDTNFNLTEKQYKALELLNSNNEVITVLFGGAAGGGKAQPLWSKVLTPNGWTTIGEIQIGDDVLSPNGSVCKVNGVYPQGKKVIYKITTTDDRETYACAEHLWLSKTTKDGKEKVRSTKDIMDLLSLGKAVSIPYLKDDKYILDTIIKSIEEYSYEEAQCISIDSPDHLYITDNFIVTHNTFLGCLWLITSALKYPNTRWLLGRKELITLMSTAVITLKDVLKIMNLKEGTHWKQYYDRHITFNNGSVILFKDLKHMPSDPDYDTLGSLEITGAFIEEIPQITERCYELIISRIRYKLDEYGLSPKLFGSCNPNRGWGYTTFYKPFKDNTLPKHIVFIPALTSDNPYISKHYVESLGNLNDLDRERLLYGNWDVEDGESRLFDNQWISGIGKEPISTNGIKYLTVDVARHGEDNTILCVWNDTCVIDIEQYSKLSVTESSDKVIECMRKYNIQPKYVLVDEAGVGGGVLDILRNKGIRVVGFLGAAKTIRNHNYQNLRQECYFSLVDMSLSITDNVRKMMYNDSGKKINMWDAIHQDLFSIKRKTSDDGKPKIISKSVIKNDIGRSPDLGDVLSMRVFFNLKPKGGLGLPTI